MEETKRELNEKVYGERINFNSNWEDIICPYCKNKNQRSLLEITRFNIHPVSKWTKCDFCKKRINLK
jgi:hypothetical protein